MSDKISDGDRHLEIMIDLLNSLGVSELVDYTFKGIRKYGFNKEKVKEFAFIGNPPHWNEYFDALWATVMLLPKYRKQELRI